MTSQEFWSRKLGEFQELWNGERIDRYRDILPMVERAARLETAGKTDSGVWVRNLESITRKIVDEWPFDDEHGLEILRYVQAMRERKR